jgi:peptidoglycan hydrolase-like protein with peptidoglycan-binding domain
VLARNDVPRVNNVNFSLSVGAVVPARVRVGDADPVLVEMFPHFRGHKFFVVRDEIVIVDNSRKVVAVLPAGSSAGGTRVGGGAGMIDLGPDQIREVQMMLIQKGFDIGEPDGRLGPRTRQALIAFQRQRGLQATGQIDTRTMTALGVSITTGQRGDQGPAQPSTSGQGGAGNQPPANQNTGAGQQGKQEGTAPPSTAGRGGAGAQQRPADANTGGAQHGNQPSTTGQGSEKMQQPPANQNPGAADRPANQKPERSNPGSGR